MQHFRARRQKSGTIYYYFDAGGKPRKEIPLGKDYVVAVRKWTQLMAEAAPAVVTFADLADKYEREVIPLKAKSTQTLQRFDLKALREFFCTPAPAPLDQIKPSHIHKMLQWKKDQPTTANRLKRQFSHMFNMARAWGYTEATNPVTGIRGFALAKRENYITDEVFKAVWDCATPPLRDAMDLAYLTGQRPGDALRMTERDIVDGMLLVEQGKTGAKLRIRVEGKLAALLKRIKARKDVYKVWSANLTVNTRGMPLTANTLRNLFDTARVAAATAHPELATQIKAMRFYDLRAKAADDVSDEHGEQAAANLLGHDSVTTTQRHYLRKGRVVGPTK
jgi:integrase